MIEGASAPKTGNIVIANVDLSNVRTLKGTLTIRGLTFIFTDSYSTVSTSGTIQNRIMQETVDRSLESEDGKVAVNCTQYGYDYVYSIPGGSKTTAFAYRSYFSNVYLNNRKLTIQSDISFNGTASGWINIPCYIDALWNKYVYVGKTSLHSTDYYPRAMLSVQIEKGSVGSIYVFLEVKSNNHADLYTGVEKEQLDDEQQYGGKINSIKFGLDFYNKVIVTRYKPDAYLF